MNRHPLALAIGMHLIGMRVPALHETERWDRIRWANLADVACYVSIGMAPKANR